MKQQKLTGYKPNYPKKVVRGMALAAAALMTVGTTAGCKARTADRNGAEPRSVFQILFPAEEIQTEGYVAPENVTPEPEDLRTGGVAMPEETPEPDGPIIAGYPTLPPEETPEPDEPMLGGVPMPEPTPEPEEIMLSGDVAIIDVP